MDKKSLLLSEGDLHELTGYVRPDAQIRWLKKNGWKFVVTGFNRPRVSKDYAESRLGLHFNLEQQHTSSGPDFSTWGGPAL